MHSTASPSRQSAPWTQALSQQGYCIIPDALPGELVRDLDATLDPHFEATPFGRGNFYGEKTKRFGRLLSRAPASALLVEHPLVIEIVETLLGRWCDHVQLNLTQAIEIHPGEAAQVPHRDQDMWHAEKGRLEYVINVMWPLTAFSAENGATLIWPGTHGEHALDAPPQTAPIAAEAEPGSAILFLGSTLHSGGANISHASRRGLVVGYSLGWLKAYENPYLAYPPQVARHFPPRLAALVGYRQHRPNLGNFEGQCPTVLFQDEVPQALAATDALMPEQAAMIAAWRAGKRDSAGQRHSP
ncbi:phytanoyl-CoA dioxygenase family protein [Sphingomonas colocasiae]|uniref:Phytanoyl-CoA dioxygenase family protein n=1 Tax=Sphingomonas colocasiae TaxID=1848973 RepID=A0ABS7PPU7_9SPHN|nr:phytanoyl-CoA dioxygenase family protein [Sphingomonas colocasiae]MBY8823266.1 phytanoyl-CoA dioxygenase family protein [Sphingomonas colocasiae]